jgi:hypothetical protein
MAKPLGDVTTVPTDHSDLTGMVPANNMTSMSGDSGSGGTKGIVPAPDPGDASAGKFLKADGTWAIPPSGGVSTFDSISSGTNTSALMHIGSGATLDATGTGTVNATKVNGMQMLSTGSGTVGKIPIDQGNGTSVWADPLVQGIQAEGTSGTTVNPVRVCGVDGSNNLKTIVLDSSGRQTVNVNGTVPVSGTFFQATQPVSIAATVNTTDANAQSQGSATSGQKGFLEFGAVTTAAPTYTTAQSSPFSLTTAGSLRTDNSSWAGTALGTPTNFGTTPGAVIVAAVNASLAVGTTMVSAAAPVPISATAAANTNANPIFASVTDGTTKVTVIAATAALKTDLSSVAGTATVTAAAGVQKVGIVGNANASVDAAVGTLPTNNLANISVPSSGAGAACSVGNAASLTVLNIKASAGNVYGVTVVNKTASVIYLQFYNTAGTPTLGTSVVSWIPIAASGVLVISPGSQALQNFATGIGIGASTTPTSTGTPGTAPDVSIWFK